MIRIIAAWVDERPFVLLCVQSGLWSQAEHSPENSVNWLDRPGSFVVKESSSPLLGAFLDNHLWLHVIAIFKLFENRTPASEPTKIWKKRTFFRFGNSIDFPHLCWFTYQRGTPILPSDSMREKSWSPVRFEDAPAHSPDAWTTV